MSTLELTEFLVKNLVKEPELVSVKEYNDEDEAVIEILVSDSDMGAVIGRSGNIAKSIRTLVNASHYAKTKERIRINIDSY